MDSAFRGDYSTYGGVKQETIRRIRQHRVVESCQGRAGHTERSGGSFRYLATFRPGRESALVQRVKLAGHAEEHPFTGAYKVTVLGFASQRYHVAP